MDTAFLQDTVSQILTKLELPFGEIKVSQEEDIVRVDIESEQASKLIGWHGETLNSVQHLVKAIIRTKESLDRSPFIVLDVDNYRRDQEDKVRRIAGQKADFVRRTGNRVVLAPMSPYFRRIVHLHVANSEDLQDLTTESQGEGDYRQIVLRLKEEKGSSDVKVVEDEELAPVIEEDSLDNLDI